MTYETGGTGQRKYALSKHWMEIMDSCAKGAGCTDAGRARRTTLDGTGTEPRRTTRDLTPSQRRELLLLAHADFALFHGRDEAHESKDAPSDAEAAP